MLTVKKTNEGLLFLEEISTSNTGETTITRSPAFETPSDLNGYLVSMLNALLDQKGKIQSSLMNINNSINHVQETILKLQDMKMEEKKEVPIEQELEGATV